MDPDQHRPNSQSQGISPEDLAQLLRPVRDYTALWHIPLANYLDTFHSELRIGHVSDGDPDPDGHEVNFSQAALFIQAITGIFDRKVSHLYGIVMSAKVPNEPEHSDRKHRKAKESDWIVDGELVRVEEPEGVPTLRSSSEAPLPDRTLMPRSPVCFLHSLEGPTRSSPGGSFRLDAVPDSKTSVIVLDPMHRFGQFDEARVRVEEEEDVNEPAPQPESDSEFEAPPPFPQEFAEELPEVVEVESDGEEQRPRFTTLALDKETSHLELRPFRKMNLEKVKLPTGFGDRHAAPKKLISRKPFHESIFAEVFEKLKAFRKSRKREEKRGILAALPRESGREHALENIEAYMEPPPMPDDDYEEDESPTPVVAWAPESGRDTYSMLCQQFVQRMVMRGQEKVARIGSSQVLADWERKLTPILEREESMKSFDVQESMEWIKNMLRSHDNEMTFKAMTTSLKPHEVARVFLSVLMLASTQEVVVLPGNREGTTQEFAVRLKVDSALAPEAMEE